MTLMKNYEFTIVDKKIEGKNIMRIIFEAPEPLGNMEPSVFLRIYNDKGESKPYTPLKIEGRQVHHAIKIYENGPVSSFLANLSVGDKVRVSELENKRKFTINEHKNILMICGGTGITPMYQILSYAMNNPKCTSKFKVLFFNTSKESVFLFDELKKLQELKMGSFMDVSYIMTGRSKDDKLLRTSVTEPIKEACLNTVYDFVYVCGTDGFLGTVCGQKTKDKQQGELSGLLKTFGYTSETVYKF
ncbi:cytochrome-b5 reductase [Pancytospora epiphaga]|nr:cytochrome-b5 reductase [Pancytospora epiphaga]